MNHLIHLKELRENVSKYADSVAKGNSFVVMKRSKPLFKISPIDEDGWETVIDFTKFRRGGMPVHEVIKALEAID